MADFNKDIGGIGYNNIPVAAEPTVAVDNANTTLLAQIAGEGLGAFKGYQVSKLKGADGDAVPTQSIEVPTTISYGTQTNTQGLIQNSETVEVPDLNSIVNFNQIKTAVQQGKLNYMGANVLARRTVTNAIAQYPGLAPELKQAYQNFFGALGPGGGVLDPTAQDKLNEAVQKQWQTAYTDLIIDQNLMDSRLAIELQKRGALEEYDQQLADINLPREVRRSVLKQKAEALARHEAEAQLLGFSSPESYSKYKRLQSDVALDKNRLDLLAKERKISTEDFLSGNNRVAAAEFQQDIALIAARSRNGTLGQEEIRQAKVEIRSKAQGMIADILANSPSGTTYAQVEAMIKPQLETAMLMLDENSDAYALSTSRDAMADTAFLVGADNGMYLNYLRGRYSAGIANEVEANLSNYEWAVDNPNTPRANAIATSDGYKAWVNTRDARAMFQGAMDSLQSRQLPQNLMMQVPTVEFGQNYLSNLNMSSASEQDMKMADNTVATLVQAGTDKVVNIPSAISVLRNSDNVETRKQFEYQYSAEAQRTANLLREMGRRGVDVSLNNNQLTVKLPSSGRNAGKTFTTSLGIGGVDRQLPPNVSNDVVAIVNSMNNLYNGAMRVPELTSKGKAIDLFLSKELQQSVREINDLYGEPAERESVGRQKRNTSKKIGQAELNDAVSSASQAYGVDPDLIQRVIKAESNFNPNATSKVGAQGLMQLMPATAEELGVADPFNPSENVQGGTKYLSQLLSKYNGNQTLALMGYNWGMGNVDKWLSSGGNVPKETKNYIKKILNEDIGPPEQYL